ncbi:hypothetical protein [Mycobacterium phage WXIN]|nr:hypothetical protein [Mycobacterium phage WXIN]
MTKPVLLMALGLVLLGVSLAIPVSEPALWVPISISGGASFGLGLAQTRGRL